MIQLPFYRPQNPVVQGSRLQHAHYPGTLITINPGCGGIRACAPGRDGPPNVENKATAARSGLRMQFSTNQGQDLVRVSGAGLVLLQPADHRILLLPCHRSLSEGTYLLVPPGGVYRIHESRLLDRVNPVFENREKQEMRFWVEPAHLAYIYDWFALRIGRETSPARELREELVEEARLVTDLDLNETTLTYLGTTTAMRPSVRAQAEGSLTLYFHEVFKGTLPRLANHELLTAVRKDSNMARLVTAEEVAAGKTRSGTVCGCHAKELLKYLWRPTVFDF